MATILHQDQNTNFPDNLIRRPGPDDPAEASTGPSHQAAHIISPYFSVTESKSRQYLQERPQEVLTPDSNQIQPGPARTGNHSTEYTHTAHPARSQKPKSSTPSQRGQPSSLLSTTDCPLRIVTTYWEEERTWCYELEYKQARIARRHDNDMVNGTKLLNFAGVRRGRRDCLLKSVRMRYVANLGPSHLKGIWVPLEKAVEFAKSEGLADLLKPLLSNDIECNISRNTDQPVAAKLNPSATDTDVRQRTSYLSVPPSPPTSSSSGDLSIGRSHGSTSQQSDRINTPYGDVPQLPAPARPSDVCNSANSVASLARSISKLTLVAGYRSKLASELLDQIEDLRSRIELQEETRGPGFWETFPGSERIQKSLNITRATLEKFSSSGGPDPDTSNLIGWQLARNSLGISCGLLPPPHQIEQERAEPSHASCSREPFEERADSEQTRTSSGLADQEMTSTPSAGGTRYLSIAATSNEIMAFGKGESRQFESLPGLRQLGLQVPELSTSGVPHPDSTAAPSNQDLGIRQEALLPAEVSSQQILASRSIVDRAMMEFLGILSTCTPRWSAPRAHPNRHLTALHQSNQNWIPPLHDQAQIPAAARKRSISSGYDMSTKRQARSPVEGQPTHRKYACPFFKRNPSRYSSFRSCPGPGWSSVYRLKEHLYRIHMLLVYCPRCFDDLESDDHYLSHMKDIPPCEPREFAAKEGISPFQERLLRSGRWIHMHMSEESKWRDVYRILFPADDPSRTPTPYYEPDSPTIDAQPQDRSLVKQYESFLRMELPARFHHQVTLLVTSSLNNAGPATFSRAELNRMARALQIDLFQIFKSQIQLQRQTTARHSSTQQPGEQQSLMLGYVPIDPALRQAQQFHVDTDSELDGYDGIMFDLATAEPDTGYWTLRPGLEHLRDAVAAEPCRA